MKSDGFNSAFSPVVYGDIALSINTHYITLHIVLFGLVLFLIQFKSQNSIFRSENRSTRGWSVEQGSGLYCQCS